MLSVTSGMQRRIGAVFVQRSSSHNAQQAPLRTVLSLRAAAAACLIAVVSILIFSLIAEFSSATLRTARTWSSETVWFVVIVLLVIEVFEQII